MRGVARYNLVTIWHMWCGAGARFAALSGV